jgi:UDPglucose--hexose-1-phosphate uridylyltransferase
MMNDRYGDKMRASEMRMDWMTGDWVIVSPLRSNRPMPRASAAIVPEDKADCPFCPGHENMTPPEIWADRENGEPDGPGWWVRSFPNLYPALSGGGCDGSKGDSLQRVMRGCGVHEVIVDCPEHDIQPATMTIDQLERLLLAYRERYRENSRIQRIRYVQIFRNHGREAGRSIIHPHSQLVGTPIVPNAVMEEIRRARQFHDERSESLFDRALERELDEGTRVVVDSDSIVVMCPFASRSPYEMYLLQNRGITSFKDSDDDLIRELAIVLKDVLVRMYELLDDPPYNIYIHSSPCDDGDYRFFRWHIHIIPRLIGQGGFEMGTGMCINPVPPERAALLLRKEGADQSI